MTLSLKSSERSQQIKQQEGKYLLQNYARSSFVLERAVGAELFDVDGNRYLDFLSGIAVTPLGHANPALLHILQQQSQTLGHVSNLFHSIPQVELARLLCESSFADRAFFCNSGTEANEAAMKFARRKTGRPKFLAFEGGFHGRTMGALSITSNARYRDPFAPLVPGATFCEFNDMAASQVIDQETAAVFVEPVQGEGGVFPAQADFLKMLRERTQEVGALLVFDEVQCGLGRSGSLWAHQQYGVEPDMMTLAKPLANGLPIGAVLMSDEVARAIVPGDHGSTFAAGPVVCALAAEVVRQISDPQMLERIRSLGSQLENALQRLKQQFPLIVELRGRGLIWGLQLDSQIPVSEVVQQAARDGLIVAGSGHNTLRLLPPYILDPSHLVEAEEKLRKTLGRFQK